MQIAQPARVRETDFTQCSLHALTHPTFGAPKPNPSEPVPGSRRPLHNQRGDAA
jgi:hypothetical protein